MTDLSQYSIKAADWRGALRKNQARTRWVIAIYVLLYTSLGLLVDLYIATTPLARTRSADYGYAVAYQPDYGATLHQLVTFQIFPIATCLLFLVAVFSLFITYWLYDKIMLLGTEYVEVNADSTELDAKQLYNIVEELTIAAGLKYVPRVFIIEANYMNAFASGYSEKSAMVAITRGLMQKLNRAEIQAVMAHELSHIRHLDIKITLTVAVLSNLMLIVVDLLFYNMIFSDRRRESEGPLFLAIILLRYLLPILTVLLGLFLSRTREYMADAGCVELMRDNESMASALIKIDQDHQTNADEYSREYGATAHEDVRRAAYIYDPVKAGIEPVHDISSLFSTHPSLADRLAAIGVIKKR